MDLEGSEGGWGVREEGEGGRGGEGGGKERGVREGGSKGEERRRGEEEGRWRSSTPSARYMTHWCSPAM